MDDESSIHVTAETTLVGLDTVSKVVQDTAPKNEGVVLHNPDMDSSPNEADNTAHSPTLQQAEDEECAPFIHMRSTKPAGAKKTIKKIGSLAVGSHEFHLSADKPKKGNQPSTTKRLPTQTAKGKIPMVSVASISATGVKTAKVTSIVDGAPQTKKKKKVTKPVGDNPYLAEGDTSKNAQSYPFSFGQQQLSPPLLSTAQAAVNEMMRTALQEYQYSARGSIVETDDESLDEVDIDGPFRNENDFLTQVWCVESSTNTTPTLMKVDRSLILASMKKRLRMEGHSIQQTFSHNYNSKRDPTWENEDNVESEVIHDENDDKDESGLDEEQEEDYVKIKAVEINAQDTNSKLSTLPVLPLDHSTEDIYSKKKRKRGNRRDNESEYIAACEIKVNDVNHDVSDLEAVTGTSHSTKVNGTVSSQIEEYYEDEDTDRKEMEESSIFGQTLGSANATWVECDKCGKWRRLRGIVDASKLPTKWYCSMNKRDPERAKCTAPEEKYDATASTPESAADQRARKHLRLWVRRLHTSENYEARMGTVTRGKKKNHSASSKEPYEWVRCCNPSCGKWRALLKFMDSSSVIEAAKNGEWYCVMNTWDEKLASCAAPQEHIPANAPPWVQRDDMMQTY